MEIYQINIKPRDNTHVIKYYDITGKSNTIVGANDEVPGIAQLMEASKAKLPTPEDNPAKTEIEQEIEELEYRLSQLKQSIGLPE